MKDKITSFINSTIKGFDLSGHKVNFKIKSDDQFRSTCSGISYLIYIIIGIAYFTYYFLQFVQRKSFNLSYATKILNPIPEINLRDQKMNISILLTTASGTPIMDLVADNTFEIVFEKSVLSVSGEQNITDIPTQICTKEFFPDISENQFEMNYISQSLCPIITPDLHIKGDYVEFQDFTSISIYVDVINKEKFQNLSKTHGAPWVKLSYLDTMVDHNSYKNYMGSFFKSHYTLIDMRMKKMERLFVSSTRFTTDNNIIYSSPKDKISATVDRLEFHNTIADLAAENPYEGGVVYYQILASNKEYLYERTYQKLTSLLADTTGVITQFLIILSIYFDAYNQKKAYKSIMNESMNFIKNERFDASSLKRLNRTDIKREEMDSGRGSVMGVSIKSNSNDNSGNNNIDKNNNDKIGKPYSNYNKVNIGNNSHSRNSSGINELKDLKDSKEINKKNDISESNANVKKSKGCFCCKKKDPPRKINDLIEDSKLEEKIDEYLDILIYMKKVSELNFLKSIILGNNNDRMELFNLLSFPTIDKEAGKSTIEYGKKKVEKLNEAYKSIYASKENRLENQNDIDIEARLIENFNLFTDSILKN